MVSESDCAAHHPQLNHAAKPIDNSRAAERFCIVKYNGYLGAGFSEFTQNFKKSSREAALGPRERGVLHYNPCALPCVGLKPKCFEGSVPPVLVPRDAPNFELNIVRDERLAEVPAIILDGVGGFVAASEQSDDALRGHFSTRKLPMTRASMPELKKVRSASVGVFTMASPRKLKEVFMMTGTPLTAPNSSIKR